MSDATGTAGKRRISSTARLVLAVAVSAVAVGAISIGFVAAAVARAGTVEVEVVETDGTNVSLSIPGALIDAGVRLVPVSVLPADVAVEIEPWWPAVQAAWDGLEDCPDVVFVEVDGPYEKVRIAKRGGVIEIDVDDHGARVRVAVPVRTVSILIDKLERVLDV
ncbi:MAG: hypothetical protein R3344_03365 [Acidobacteriota bacterium]|nr:hypothetical protein [Acidobacteriota bacterium]